VLIHGWNSHPGVADPRASLTNAGIALAGSPKAARDALAGAGIVYAPLDSLDPALLDLLRLRLRLREKLGLRSAVNTALRAERAA
jgi:anthranilate phosphoribosyltransferase